MVPSYILEVCFLLDNLPNKKTKLNRKAKLDKKKKEEIIVASTLQGWNVHFIKLVDWTEKELMLAGQWLNGIELPYSILSPWFDLN